MIIKRKLFTRQEAKAIDEIYQALKKGNVGRNLSAKKFVSARRAYNNSIRSILDQNNGNGVNYIKNSKAIEDIGLPETAKAYKRMMEKYTNPELRRRFERIQSANSNSRLRIARQKIKEANTDPLQARQEYYNKHGWLLGKDKYDYYSRSLPKTITDPNEYKNTLEKLAEIEKERAGKNYKFNKKNIISNYRNESSELESKYKYVMGSSNNQTDPEYAQKILKDLKKKGVKFVTEDPTSNYYSPRENIINLKNKASFKNPATIGHERGHQISDTRGELEGGSFYKHHESLDTYENTSRNLLQSIKNRIGTMSTLMDEANASYHQAALANKYGIPREAQKANNKQLSNAFKTYELNAADDIKYDNTQRLLGKYRNK